MILIDTGYLLALVQVRDELHERAVRWAQATTTTLLITDYVIWETINALSQPTDRAKGHLLLDHLHSASEYRLVAATPELTQAGLQLHSERLDKAWSLTDCISFIVMHDRGLTQALAHDHHFEQAGFEALLRRDPS